VKLASYSLNNVSAHFLGEQKDDVKYTEIRNLFFGNEYTRATLAN